MKSVCDHAIFTHVIHLCEEILLNQLLLDFKFIVE